MRATLSIQTRIRQPQPLHRTPMHQVFAHNLLDILHMNKPIPDRIRVDDDNRPMLTLVKTSQLVGSDLSLQPGFL